MLIRLSFRVPSVISSSSRASNSPWPPACRSVCEACGREVHSSPPSQARTDVVSSSTPRYGHEVGRSWRPLPPVAPCTMPSPAPLSSTPPDRPNSLRAPATERGNDREENRQRGDSTMGKQERGKTRENDRPEREERNKGVWVRDLQQQSVGIGNTYTHTTNTNTPRFTATQQTIDRPPSIIYLHTLS